MAGRRYTDEPLRDPETGQWDTRELRHRAKGWLAVLLAVAVLGGGLWFVGDRAWNAWMTFRTAEDFIGEGVEEIEVTIPKGTSMGGIGEILQEAGVVKSGKTFQQYALTRPDESARIQAGRYRMLTQIPASLAFDMLLDTKRIIRNMMQLREGQRLTEQVEAMSAASSLPLEQFQAVLDNPADLGLPTWSQDRPEGFFFPDTYELPENPTALGVMKIPAAQFVKVTGEMEFEARAQTSPATDPYTALIVASIIEREVFIDADRPKVARVIYNRLAEGMALQLDSTVAYAVNKTGTVWTTAAERNTDSPYNTYKYPGLPPGPITAPARAALEAAIEPAEGDWLYFVPVNLETGETEFNATKADHDRSVAKLQEWCTASDENRAKCA